MPRFELHQGDCLEILKTLPDNSVDACVSDPPYGLSDHSLADTMACLQAWLAGEEYRPKKRGFMGRSWDAWVPGPEVWREVLRVLKPGGHLLAFAGTRSMDIMSMAVRLAGFELRDAIGSASDGGDPTQAPLMAWCYGSGFPKSMDVSKAIDKARNSGRDEVLRVTAWIRARRDELSLKTSDLDAAAGTAGMAGHWVSQESQPAIPTLEQWQKLEPLLGEPPEWMRSLLLPARKPGDAWEQREVIGRATDGCGNTDASMHKVDGFAASRSAEYDITAPATDAARQWQGWGTALKPAWEPIILARKPLIGTVAQNVLEHGTGALNIDGCRVPTDDDLNGGAYAKEGGRAESQSLHGGTGMNQPGKTTGKEFVQPLGRWPANLIHDGSPEVVANFPDSLGAGGSVPNVKVTGYGDGIGGGKSEYLGGERTKVDSGSGSSARFFYCAKASRRDRNEGCESLPLVDWTKGAPNSVRPDQINTSSGKLREAVPSNNHHPTVKPTDLMAYLVRLVTPPGGVVLDPFLGSGSTGKAAIREGFRFIGCELSPEYLEIARARIQFEVNRRLASEAAAAAAAPVQRDLFSAA